MKKEFALYICKNGTPPFGLFKIDEKYVSQKFYSVELGLAILHKIIDLIGEIKKNTHDDFITIINHSDLAEKINSFDVEARDEAITQTKKLVH